MKLRTILWRSGRLRCVNCGQGRLFRGWFQMHPRCSICGMQFDRGSGYFLGSIYINYGLTALLVTAGYFACFFTEWVTGDALLYGATAFCVLFPIWFFRFARSFWLGFDYYFDPPAAPTNRAAAPAEKPSFE
ncbi:MAG TPA: DUF983 domain-containing protein [Pirellulales bacterium]|nr:DUF983 domain-containing protein [Pirellulales bacterium]